MNIPSYHYRGSHIKITWPSYLHSRNPYSWKDGLYTEMGHSPDSKVHEANMGPTWVLSTPGGPHVGPMNLAIWEAFSISQIHFCHAGCALAGTSTSLMGYDTFTYQIGQQHIWHFYTWMRWKEKRYQQSNLSQINIFPFIKVMIYPFKHAIDKHC